MRTSFRAALTDWKCVVQKAGVPLSYRHHALMRLIYVCMLCWKRSPRTKWNKPSGQDQASSSKWKDAGCFLAEQQPLPCIFFAQKPPRTICLRNVSGRNNEPASADPTKHLNANRNAKQKRQRKSRARAQGASHIVIPKHP